MKTNHRRGGKKRKYPQYRQTQSDSPSVTYAKDVLSNGHVSNEKPWKYIDTESRSFGQTSEFADKHMSTGVRRGAGPLRKAVAGAKKFVRSRFRFAEKQQVNAIKRGDVAPDEV